MRTGELHIEFRSVGPFLAFVTGPTGAGKSTLVTNVSQKMKIRAVYPGKEIRANEVMYKACLMAKNPTAVPALEDFVRKTVEKRIAEEVIENKNASLIIDGMPRSESQIRFCVDLALKYRREPVFIYVDADLEERKKRLNWRGDKELGARRLKSDDEILPEVFTHLKRVVFGGRFGYLWVVNTGKGN